MSLQVLHFFWEGIGSRFFYAFIEKFGRLDGIKIAIKIIGLV